MSAAIHLNASGRALVLKKLTALLHAHGTAKAVAEHLHLSQQYLSDVINERRAPGPKVLAALGLKRVDRYEVL